MILFRYYSLWYLCHTLQTLQFLLKQRKVITALRAGFSVAASIPPIQYEIPLPNYLSKQIRKAEQAAIHASLILLDLKWCFTMYLQQEW